MFASIGLSHVHFFHQLLGTQQCAPFLLRRQEILVGLQQKDISALELCPKLRKLRNARHDDLRNVDCQARRTGRDVRLLR